MQFIGEMFENIEFESHVLPEQLKRKGPGHPRLRLCR